MRSSQALDVPTRCVPGRWTKTTRLAAAAVLASAAALAPGAAGAALPAEVDGEPVPSLAPMLEGVMPAVVNVRAAQRVRVRQSPLLNDPFFRRFFDMPNIPRERVRRSLGSGVIVDAERGYVLTNHHVIKDADEVQITTYNERTLQAEVVGSDPETDLAVLQVDAENLTDIPLSDADRLKVGDFVVAVGNPFGLGQSVTSGIVSALGRQGVRSDLDYQNFIQTDAAINRGNSGGALVNLKGELVGINTAIFSPSGGNVGIGFAIPIGMARPVMQQLIDSGKVQRGALGVYVQNLDPELAQAFGIDNERGAVITQISPDSPADEAGLKAGDVILAIDGDPVSGSGDVRTQVGLVPVGETVRLTVLSDGDKREIEVEIGAPETRQLPGEQLDPRLRGASFGPLPPELKQRGFDNGVLVADVERGSPAWENELRPQDIVLAANRQRVNSVEDLRSVLQGEHRRILLHVRRGRNVYFVPIQ